MKSLIKLTFIINIRRLFYVKKIVAYCLSLSNLFFKSDKRNNLSCFVYFLLLFFYANSFAADHSDLAEALKAGDEKLIEQLMQDKNIHINDEIDFYDGENQHSMTPFMRIAQYGHTHLIKSFIENGADINATNCYGYTALIYAAKSGHTEMVARLITYRANLDEQDVYSHLPLVVAIFHEHVETATYLINHGADIHSQGWSGDLTPLMRAAHHGLKEVVMLLVNRGAVINQQSGGGYTPLMYAIRGNHVEIAIYLLERGADVNVQKELFGETSLTLAGSTGQVKIITNLLERGAAVNEQGYKCRTALMQAAFYDNAEAMVCLIAAGADVNIQDVEGNTALTLFMRKGEKDFIRIIRLLIRKGANFDISNPIHAKALHEAFKKFSCDPQSPPYKFDILAELLDFVQSDEINRFFVKTITAGRKEKKSFVFQYKKNNQTKEDVLIEDLSALKAALISGAPLEDAAKYAIYKIHQQDQLNQFIPVKMIESITSGSCLPLRWRLYLEDFLDKLERLNAEEKTS